MAPPWKGKIAIGDEQCIEGITIATSDQQRPDSELPAKASLRFLSIVETTRVPLSLALGIPHEVTTCDDGAERWLSSILLAEHDASSAWWLHARSDSPLGILVAVDHHEATRNGSKATELLIYASQDPPSAVDGQPTPPPSASASSHVRECAGGSALRLRVYAQLLCSNALENRVVREPTPPASPRQDGEFIEAVFLPPNTSHTTGEGEMVNLPPVRKRKTVNETFDEAAERRRRARRKGGEGVSAAAASRHPADVSMRPTSQHRRSISNSQGLPVPSRPLSRASSVASTRVSDLREPSLPTISKRSSLGRMQSTASAGADNAHEAELCLEYKNKEIVSKVVMAGMRLYGLVQSKSRKSQANSAADSPAIDTSFEDREAERQRDEEYKLVYHQVYKGTCFALRQHMATKFLQSHSEALRETVDKLLMIFCKDPLVLEDAAGADEFTPGGRKAFGSSAVADSEHKNPFFSAARFGSFSQSNTPCGRRPHHLTSGTKASRVIQMA